MNVKEAIDYEGSFMGASEDDFEKLNVIRALQNELKRLRSPEGTKGLKELRMWHWRELLLNRVEQRKFEALRDAANTPAKVRDYGNIASLARKNCTFHLGAVQALNDVLPGTAEQDCAKAE